MKASQASSRSCGESARKDAISVRSFPHASWNSAGEVSAPDRMSRRYPTHQPGRQRPGLVPFPGPEPPRCRQDPEGFPWPITLSRRDLGATVEQAFKALREPVQRDLATVD